MGHPTPRTPHHSWGTDVGRWSKFFRSSWAPDIGSGQFLYTLIFAMFKIVIQFLGQFGLNSSVHGWNVIGAWPFRAKRMYVSLNTIENRNTQTRKSIQTIYVYDMTTCTPIYEYCSQYLKEIFPDLYNYHPDNIPAPGWMLTSGFVKTK